MSVKKVIPCLDFKDGRVVKGINFVDLSDVGDPVACAMAYVNDGADELAFLDIAATNEGRGTVVEMVKKIAGVVNIPFTVGGGIRSLTDFEALFKAGATKISVNSQAVKTPDLIGQASREFGRQSVTIAIDTKPIVGTARYEVCINGGEVGTGLDAVEWAKKAESLGAGALLVTGVNTDGTKDGYDIPLLRAIKDCVSIDVIASGGAGKLEHFYQAIADGHADAVLAASLFHFKELTIREVKQYLRDKGIEVNL